MFGWVIRVGWDDGVGCSGFSMDFEFKGFAVFQDGNIQEVNVVFLLHFHGECQRF